MSARQVSPPPAPVRPLPLKPKSNIQIALLRGARSRLGDRYDDSYVVGGFPPKGRSACVDVLVSACLEVGVNLQDSIAQEIGAYPSRRDRDIDHRWAPNLRVWFQRHWSALSLSQDYRPGDIVFWNLTGDGVADHCGVISDRPGASGQPAVIHQFPPACVEEDCLGNWAIVGHFRMPTPIKKSR